MESLAEENPTTDVKFSQRIYLRQIVRKVGLANWCAQTLRG